MLGIVGIDHVAIAINDLDEAIEPYNSLLDESPKIEEVTEQNVRVAAFSLGDSRLELLEPLSEEGAVYRFLEDRGEGIHHVALRTDSIEQDLDRADQLGFTCIDSEPREGAEGYRIGFLHPEDFHGTLLELAQPLVRMDEHNA